jgi:hypothetical protein
MVARGSELLPQGPQDYLIVGSCVKDYAPFLKNQLLLAILPVMGYNHGKE